MRPHRPYELKEYDPNWVTEYSKRANIIKSIFGNELVEIHHIGSTSIPGMTAKPQIDILVLVKDFPKVKEFYAQMSAAGFTPRGTEYVGIGDEYFTEDAPDGKRIVSVHVFPEGDPSRERYLNFRDYLRSHEDDKNLYMSVKKSLYSENKENYEGYDSGKEDVIMDIRKRADKWAKTQEIIKKLQVGGYDKVYEYDAEPGEIDEEHSHPFDTTLAIISGKIRIKKLEGEVITDYSLKDGNQIEIPRGQLHSAVVGGEGCEYVVAEKH